MNIPLVRDNMTPEHLDLHLEDDMFDAIDTLIKQGLGGAMVVDGDQNLVGILTEKDCLRMISNTAYEEMGGGKVKDYMSPQKGNVHTEMDLFAVVDIFMKTHFVALPVLEQGKLVGRIARRDVLRGIRKWQQQRDNEQLKDQIAFEEGQKRPSGIEAMQKRAASHKKDQLAELFRTRR